MHTLVIGAGYSGFHIAQVAMSHGSVCGTRRSQEGVTALEKSGIPGLLFNGGDRPVPQMQDQLDRVTHLIICNAPAREQPFNDPVLRFFESGSELPSLQWVAYLSTIGVYGNYDGAWIDETSPCVSTQVRSLMRRQAEQGWSRLAKRWGVRLTVLRLSGIYGPGRNAIEDAIAGRARMLIKPAQVFNRIHVADLASAVLLSATHKPDSIINVTDDMPAPPQDVIRYAHKLAGKQPPKEVAFESAELSPMARSFYSENKRVSNALSKRLLGMHYQYPTYREGLDACFC